MERLATPVAGNRNLSQSPVAPAGRVTRTPASAQLQREWTTDDEETPNPRQDHSGRTLPGSVVVGFDVPIAQVRADWRGGGVVEATTIGIRRRDSRTIPSAQRPVILNPLEPDEMRHLI